MRIVKYLCLLLLWPFAAISQVNYNYFISNSGVDTNPGMSKSLPKQTLRGAAGILTSYALSNGSVSVGLRSGDVFNESLALPYPIIIGAYYDSSKKNGFAVLNGSDVFDVGWIKKTGTANTYQQAITTSGFTGNGGGNIGIYSYVYVVEIDKELEKAAPITARKVLQFASNLQSVDAIPGSFYEIVSDSIPTFVYIHTSDNSSPNANAKYRYEVSVRSHAVDGYTVKNNRFENLWLRGYGAGTGPIPSGGDTWCNKIIFGPGGGVHHIVSKSGAINNSLFLPVPKNIGNYAAVFYDADGLKRHNKIANSIFLDIKVPIYTHTNANGTSYGALELDNVIAFADLSEGGQFVGTSNTDTLALNKVYADGYTSGYNNVSANYVTIKNSVFKDVTDGIVFSPVLLPATVENVFIRSKAKGKGSAISMESYTSLNLTNSIIHINSNSGAFVNGTGVATNHISAKGNVFISDIDPAQSVTAATTNTERGAATSTDNWSNNVYILLRGSNIVWTVTNPGTNNGSRTVQTFEEWKKQSGQDQNSLFFDLRNDPRGLQAIFIDPDNGNYELANTVEGNKVRELKAGMTTPITCFLQKPTYEEAADMIKNDKVFSINSCRKSCQQTDVKVLSSAVTDANGLIHICQDEEQTFTGSGSYKQNDISYHQSDDNARYLWWFSDGTDTSGINLNTVSHKFSKGDTARVRLQMVDENGCSFDSTFLGTEQRLPLVNLGTDTTLCTGLDVNLTTYYPAATYLWSTGSNDNSITVKDRGIYWVQTSINGCTFRDSLEVKLQDCPCNVQMPNAFSPNGDGLNEVYRPVLGCYPLTYELSVFNRYGQMVFTTKNYTTYWDGRFRGKPLPAGIYVYTFKVLLESSQKPKLLHGSILLLP